MKKLIIALSAIFLLCIPQTLLAKEIPFSLQHLLTEYATTPLGLDTERPRFSWQMALAPGIRAIQQTAYQIAVSDEQGNEVWNSGKQQNNQSVGITYQGATLKPTTRYIWNLKVWDQNRQVCSAQSWFETGLMDSKGDTSTWSNAQWIGGGEDDMVLYAPYLPVFQIEYTLQLDEATQSSKAGFLYGANDYRLMHKEKNLYGLSNAKDQSYIKVELDITPLSQQKEALLHIYRVGYAPQDKAEKPLKSFTLPLDLINKQNGYQPHTIRIRSNLGTTQFYLDQASQAIGSLNLNPLGQGGDFIAFPIVGDLGYEVPALQKASFSHIKILNYRSPQNVIAQYGNTPICIASKGQDTRKTFPPEGHSSPMLRTTFSSKDNEITKARLYVTARGIYEVYINGEKVGQDYFNPGITQYNKTHLYQTFDVTSHIRKGTNAVGALLAEGWWSGGSSYSGDNWNYFGDRQSLLAKLVITYKDGQEQTIVTDPTHWQYCNNGPILYGSFFQGEVYDATKDAQFEGWSLPSYQPGNLWKPATTVSLKGTISTDGYDTMPWVNDYSHYQLIGQSGETIKAVKELKALSVEEVRPGIFVYDMGQNMVGVPEIHLSGLKPGTTLYLRYAEVKYPDQPKYDGQIGMIMQENIRAAMAQDIYIAKGGQEVIHPRFTYHGYRYVEITGLDTPISLENVKGIVLSSIPELVSRYETSNPLVNRLWENITWSAQGNFMSMPTDCPQRNERMGWAGDISVFSRTSTYLADVSQFLRRYLRSMRDIQRADGRFTDIAPIGGGFGGILWGSAGITLPWECYQQFGDKTLLEEHYDAMKRYIHYILEKTTDKETGLIVQNRAWADLGDWLGLEDEKNDKSLLWEAYFCYDLYIMKEVSAALGKTSDNATYTRMYEDRKALFNRTYIRPSDGKTIFSAFDPKRQGSVIDIQTSYALPLAFHLIDDTLQEKVMANLVETITRENRTDQGTVCPPYSLLTGFIGTAWISKALSDNGRADLAYRLLQQTTYPSWLYPVEQGATTIWERLNSYTRTDGFGDNNRMNSFNHYSFGAVGSWMYNYSLGIQRDDASPAFKHFILQPEVDPTGNMTFAKGHYDSMYGRIESSWEKQAENTRYRFVVPGNTSATLYLPASSLQSITEGGKQITKKSKGITIIAQQKNRIVLELQSGSYDFGVK